MGTNEIEEMGPVDYLLVEWPGRQPTRRGGPLSDRPGRPGPDPRPRPRLHRQGGGRLGRPLEISDLGDEVEEFAAFEGASSGLLSDEDTAEAGNALEPGTSAALLVYENCWAAPFAAAVRRSGGQLVASGRIPIQDDLAALDAAEATPREGRKHMPGLLRGVARTAVIAGTATTVSNRVSRRQGQRWAAQEEQQMQQQAAAAPAPAAPPAGEVDDRPAQGAGRTESAGDPHRGGVRGPEGQDPRRLRRVNSFTTLFQTLHI